jgi:hypothetical protein
MKDLFLGVFVIIVLAWLQIWQNFSFLGIKPNLMLIIALALPFFVQNIFDQFFLVALVLFLVKISPVANQEVIFLTIISVISIFLGRRMPGWYMVNHLFLVLISVFLWYIYFYYKYLFTAIFWEELVLNSISGLLIFAFLQFLWQNKIIKAKGY